MLSPVISKIVGNPKLTGTSTTCFHNIFHLTIRQKITVTPASAFIKRFTPNRKCWPPIYYTESWNIRNCSSKPGGTYETVSGLRQHELYSSTLSARKTAPILKNQPLWFTKTSIVERAIFTSQNPEYSIKGHSTSNSDPKVQSNSSNLSNITNQKHENVITIPNLLCLSRIIAAPYISFVIINNGNFSLALAIFMYAGFTDALDGWIARRFPSQQSALGSFLDPLSDKILMTTMYLTLTYVHLIPAALTALVVSRDIFLIWGGLYVRYMGVIPPFTMKKYFDMSLPSAQVLPTTISKVNTMVQLFLVAVALTAPIFSLADHPAYYALCGLTAGTTFASAASYAFSKSVYKFKFREHDHQYGKRISVFITFILFNIAFVYLIPIRYPESENELIVNNDKDTEV